jgi:antitoxin VapB
MLQRFFMALNIKNTEVERLAAKVARITGETKVEAIRRALEERRGRLIRQCGKKVRSKSSKTQDRMSRIMDYLEREVWPNIPNDILGMKMTKREREEILGMHI